MAKKVTPCQRHPEWINAKKYESGEIVQYRTCCYIYRADGNYWKPYKHPEQTARARATLFEFGDSYRNGDLVLYRGIRYEATKMIRYAHLPPHKTDQWRRCPDHEQPLSPLPPPDRLAMLEF